jgi:uncharacterized protein YigA (DUF484 family)
VTSNPKKAGIEREPRLTAGWVKAYLEAHPDFLNAHPNLLTTLTPPAHRRGDTVVDMQRFMLDRLQREVAKLDQARNELVAAGRSNLSSQSQVHIALLALLEARTFEQFIDTVTAELASRLDVDTVSLCIERANEGDTAGRITCGVRVVERGTVNHWLGEDRDVVLQSSIEGDPALYGEAAPLVRAEALLRLKIGAHAPLGMLAIGSRDSDRFHSGQGTELLSFMGGAMGRMIGGWLYLPA